jgi:xylan 1,4-beta-xylosidase
MPVGPKLNAAVISDEGGRGEHGSFTGAFVGMLCFDTSGSGREARFPYFSYIPRVV